MHLTEKQYTLLQQLHVKGKMSSPFFDYNMHRILKLIKNAKKFHFVLKSSIHRRKFKRFIRYNFPKKSLIRRKRNVHSNYKRRLNRKFHKKIRKLRELSYIQRQRNYFNKRWDVEKNSDHCIKENEISSPSEKSCSPITVHTNLDDDTSKVNLDTSFKQIGEDKTITLTYKDSTVDCVKSDEKIHEPEKKIFCEKTGTFKSISEMNFINEKIINTLEIENNDESIDTISNSDSEQLVSEIDNILSSEQIEQQLKTQLELLKCGKRTVSLLSEKTNDIKSPTIKQISNKKHESDLRFSVLLNNKRLSSENYSFDLVEESSEDSGSTDIAKLQNSKIDTNLSKKLNIKHTHFKNKKINPKYKKDSIIDSFEISEKDALEAGPSSKVPDTSRRCDNTLEPMETTQTNTDFEEIIEQLFDIKQPDLPKRSTSIVDSLMTKLNYNLENKTNKSTKPKIKDAIISVKTVEQINNSTVINPVQSTSYKYEDMDSSSCEDFHGFSRNEIATCKVLPGMLPTPTVPAFSNISAFISKDDKHVAIPRFRHRSLPKKIEEGLVCSGRPPPKFEMAALPEEMAKPRTLAEKRLIFAKQRSFKYFMIENENTIYHELKRRSRDGRINTNLVKSVQFSKVPASRDLWKATCWLLTENEKFYFQTIEIDNFSYKILSGLGNFLTKQLPAQYSSPVFQKKTNYSTKCPANCLDRNLWQIIRVRYKNTVLKTNVPKLKLLKEENRPGPLSFKKRFLKNLKNDCNELETYKLPKIELEVYPKLNQPLDDYVKSYLKKVLPSHSLSKEWAEFAVSTLIKKENQLDNNNSSLGEVQIQILQAKNSFKFTIPYLNDQTHILVRRVLTRSENFDNTEKLTFFDVLKNNNDKVTMESADVLSDMIDSVAIGLSENSFIQNDPDINYNHQANIEKPLERVDSSTPIKNAVDEEETPDEKKQKKKGKDRKAKLLAELKRLNATIINASNPKIGPPKNCEKDFCRLGCICMTLEGNYVAQQHCKKIKCMLEKCNCPLTLIEPGNSIISSEDAYILRQKATARLAKIEREFTSTVVLAGDETLLINENQTKRIRRNNPRLRNYYTKGLEDDEIKSNKTKNTSPIANSSLTPTKDYLSHDEEPVQTEYPVKEAKLPTYTESVCIIDEDILKKLKHCSVSLTRLENIQSHLVWCMVHCLYKCFCNGKDVEGKPYILKKQEEEKLNDMYMRKAKYSFEKPEDEIIISESPKQQIKIDATLEKNTNAVVSNAKPVPKCDFSSKEISFMKNKTVLQIADTMQIYKENRIISAYVNNDFYGCHRVQPVPNVYNTRNQRPENKVLPKDFPETEATQKLLKEKIQMSERYVRKIIVKRQPTNPLFKKNMKKNNISNIKKGDTNNKNHNKNNINNDNNNNSNDNKNKNQNIAKRLENDENINNKTLTTSHGPKSKKSVFVVSPKSRAKSNLLAQTSLIKPEVRAKLNASTNDLTKNQELAQSDSTSLKTSSSPIKISSVVSLKDCDVHPDTNLFLQDKNPTPSPTTEEVQSNVIKALNNSQFVVAAEQVQKEVMKHLNFSVTKAMHTISQIQNEDNTNIPIPQLDVLISLQWRHLLKHYLEDKIHIWQVNIEEAKYFVCTLQIGMPFISNAIGIINVKAINTNKLPLFGRMLHSKHASADTLSLSVLMCGQKDYWRIAGFTKTDSNGPRIGVIRPTAQTHPNLTPKINKLFNILTQQYIENVRKRNTQSTPSSIASLQHTNKKPKLDINDASLANSNDKSQMNVNSMTIPHNKSTLINMSNINNNIDNNHNSIKNSVTNISDKNTDINNSSNVSKDNTNNTKDIDNNKSNNNTKDDNTKISNNNSSSICALGGRDNDFNNDCNKSNNNVNNSCTFSNISSTNNTNNKSNIRSYSIDASTLFKNGSLDSLEQSNVNKNNILKMNIKIRRLTKEEALNEHFQVPITANSGDHRWLVIDLEEDFSHMVFANTMESLSYNKIKVALQRSQIEKKMVRFPRVDGHAVDCYIMKFDNKRVYLGPFHEKIDPIIMLYQNVEGKMILREDFDKLYNINRQKYTTGFWLCRKNGKIMFDMDFITTDANNINVSQTQTLQNVGQLFQQQQTLNKKVLSSPQQKVVPCNGNQNSIIKLTAENIPLIHSQCNNILVSDLNNKHKDQFKINNAVSSDIKIDSTCLKQHIIKQVNKIITKPPIGNLDATSNMFTANAISKNVNDTNAFNSKPVLEKLAPNVSALPTEENLTNQKLSKKNHNSEINITETAQTKLKDKTNENNNMNVENLKDMPENTNSIGGKISNSSLNANINKNPSPTINPNVHSTKFPELKRKMIPSQIMSSTQVKRPSMNFEKMGFISSPPNSNTISKSALSAKIQDFVNLVNAKSNVNNLKSKEIDPTMVPRFNTLLKSNMADKVEQDSLLGNEAISKPEPVALVKAHTPSNISTSEPQFISETVISSHSSGAITKALSSIKSISSTATNTITSETTPKSSTAVNTSIYETKTKPVTTSATMITNMSTMISSLTSTVTKTSTSTVTILTTSITKPTTSITKPASSITKTTSSITKPTTSIIKPTSVTKSTTKPTASKPSSTVFVTITPKSTFSPPTSSPSRLETKNILNLTVPQNKTTEKTSCIAQVEKQDDGKVIVKLPEKIHNEMLSQRFTISKSENGTIILEPSNANSSKSTTQQRYNKRSISGPTPINSVKTITNPKTENTKTIEKSEDRKKSLKEDEGDPLNTEGENMKTKKVTPRKRKSEGVPVVTKKRKITNKKQIEPQITNLNKSMPTKLRKSSEPTVAKITEMDNSNIEKTKTTPEPENQNKKVSNIEKKSVPKINNATEKANNSNNKNKETLISKETKKIDNTEPNQEIIPKSFTSSDICPSSTLKLTTNDKPVKEDNVEKTMGKTTVLFTQNKNNSSTRRKSGMTISKIITSSTPASTTYNLKGKDLRKIYTAKRTSLPSTISSQNNAIKKVSPSQKLYKMTTVSSKQITPNRPTRRISIIEKNKTIKLTEANIANGYITGYFICSLQNYPKFGGYKKDNFYLIRTNSNTGLILPSIEDVTKHLNTFIRKQFPKIFVGSGKWRFVSFKDYSESLKKNLNCTSNNKNPSKLNTSIDKDLSTEVIIIDDDDEEDHKKKHNLNAKKKRHTQ